MNYKCITVVLLNTLNYFYKCSTVVLLNTLNYFYMKLLLYSYGNNFLKIGDMFFDPMYATLLSFIKLF